MRFGLLGIDNEVREVLAAAVARGDEIVLACDQPTEVGLAGPVMPPTARAAPWEALMDAQACDAVLVGREQWNEMRAEAVRKLVQAGRTLVLSQPLELSMLWAYELDMIRKDSGARLVPILPDRLHPFVARLRQAIEAGLGGGPLGDIETIEMTRRLGDRSRDSVLRHLARDADLVRTLVGDPERLSTLGGAGPDAGWATLAVGFTGASAVPVRWHVGRGTPEGLTITVVGSGGSQTLELPDGPIAEWTWSAPSGVERAVFDRGATILGVLDGSLAPPVVRPAGWDDAARAIELAESVPRSLAKGRAIDLHQEEFSELGTFRGTMASLGCGLVLAALFVLLVATLVGGIAREAGWDLGERIAGVWPVAVLTVLGLFLALQLLPLLIAPAARPRGGPASRTLDPKREEFRG